MKILIPSMYYNTKKSSIDKYANPYEHVFSLRDAFSFFQTYFTFLGFR